MAQNFTEAVQHAIEAAFQTAQAMNHSEVTENHLLKAFLDDPEGYFPSVLSNLKGDPMKLLAEVNRALSKMPTLSSPQEPQPGRSLQNRLAEAQAIMKEWKDTFLSTDHILLSYWKNGGEPFESWKKATGLKYKEVEDQIKFIRGDRHMDSPTAESSLQALEKYCKNLTALAKSGKVDPVIGRDEEIRRTMQVLSRRTKNNPMLIGEPGVGKTAIAEGLAQRIIQNDVPDSLRGKEILALDMGSLVAGTKFRGNSRSG